MEQLLYSSILNILAVLVVMQFLVNLVRLNLASFTTFLKHNLKDRFESTIIQRYLNSDKICKFFPETMISGPGANTTKVTKGQTQEGMNGPLWSLMLACSIVTECPLAMNVYTIGSEKRRNNEKKRRNISLQSTYRHYTHCSKYHPAFSVNNGGNSTLHS